MRKLLITTTILFMPALWAGSISLKWDIPSDLSNVIGYRVFYSTVENEWTDYVELNQNQASEQKFYSLTDCTNYWFMVRSYNLTQESENSNVVEGYPRPRIETVSSPNYIKPGETKSFTVTGANFMPGGSLDLEDLTVTLTGHDCFSATFEVSVPSGANLGPRRLEWLQPNPNSSGGNVFGGLTNAIEVIDQSAQAGDEISPLVATYPESTSPIVTPKGGGIVTHVMPTVKFTETILRSTEGAIRLEDEFGASHPIDHYEWNQDSDHVTIHLAQPLQHDTQYRIIIYTTLSDPAGNLMAEVFEGPYFTTESEPDTTTPEAPVISLSGDEITWTEISGAHYYKIFRDGFLATNTQVHYPPMANRSGAMRPYHHIAFDGEFVAGEIQIEFPNIMVTYSYTVQACKDANGLEICSVDSNAVLYEGRQFMCIEGGAEVPCYEGAPTLSGN